MHRTLSVIRLLLLGLLGQALVVSAAPAYADVDLVTVPDRSYLQLTIYNSEDLTLVRERRTLTLKRGLNRIQFAWHGTLIDPTSVSMMPLAHQDDVVLMDTTYPPGRPDVCQWSIASGVEGPVPVEIWYFTSGITWQANYVCLANADETQMTLEGRIRVVNNSGEDYPNAQVRVVVGSINLVEAIADLARRGHPNPGPQLALRGELQRFERKSMKRQKAQLSLEECDDGPDAAFAFKQAKRVKKEGLSEYFIFTIEGSERVQNGWSKQLRALEVAQVPLKVLYKFSDAKTGGRLLKYYRFDNKELKRDAKGQLGESPLPDGEVRAFKSASGGDLVYVGQTHTQYVPIDEKVDLELGADPDVTHRRVLAGYERTHITLDGHGSVASYREQFHYTVTLDNTRAVAVQAEVERTFCGDFELHELKGAERFEKIDKQTAKYYVDVPARTTRTIRYRVEVFQPSRN